MNKVQVGQPKASEGAWGLRTACSRAEDAVAAAAEVASQLAGPDVAFVLLFCSSHYDLPALAEALTAEFGDIPVAGCTSSGELTPFGYQDGAITGIAFCATEFSLAVRRIDDLDRFDAYAAKQAVRELLAESAEASRALGPDAAQVALFLVDGLCIREEMLTIALHEALGDMPLIGGSVGDDLAFKKTFVLHEGAFHRDSAVLIVLSTTRPFKVFSHHNLVASNRKLVVTEANPAERVVIRINDEPAAQEYARLIGRFGEPLTPSVFAAHPVMVRAGGDYYVRSIQKANPDDSLTFFCAIDEGLVLTLANTADFELGLDALFADLTESLGKPELILGFDCVHRSLELEQLQLKQKVGRILAANKVVGFCTYGEQINATHLNQTFTGLAIGRGRNA